MTQDFFYLPQDFLNLTQDFLCFGFLVFSLDFFGGLGGHCPILFHSIVALSCRCCIYWDLYGWFLSGTCLYEYDLRISCSCLCCLRVSCFHVCTSMSLRICKHLAGPSSMFVSWCFLPFSSNDFWINLAVEPRAAHFSSPRLSLSF